MKFCETIKYLRRSSKLTQEQVASYIGVKRVAYTAYEAGRTYPSLENVVKLAKLYNVTTDTLLDCYVNASAVISSNSSDYNEADDRFRDSVLTKAERELLAMYRLSDKQDAIMAYAKKTLQPKAKK